MIILNNGTKKGDNFTRQYFNSYMEFLHNCYNNYSYEKAKAFNECVNIQHRFAGSNGRIISYNCNFFTYAFICDSIQLDMQILVVITYSNIYLIASDKLNTIEKVTLREEFTRLLYKDLEKSYI